VIGYLKDFLFDERQARGPVSALSGGERARLLLARIMARESNLLVLDEPTNDLDIETLDLLQELIADFDGTVLMISHDRDFLDRVATTTIAMEGDGRAVIYAGGWSDYRAQRGAGRGPGAEASKAAIKPAIISVVKTTPKQPQRRPSRLSFVQQKRLDGLPVEIKRLEAEIAKLERLLGDPDLFTREPVKFGKVSKGLEQRQGQLEVAEEEWLELEELRDANG
jgi:ATP-binding cassette subfamily F protein uup